MNIIQGRAGTGTTKELLKRFLEDTDSATFISDEIGIAEIFSKRQYLQSNGVNIIDEESKQIKTNMFANCNSDYYEMVQNLNTKSIYLDIHISRDFKQIFIDFCVDIEREYGLNIVMIEQLSADSDIKGINILEYGI